MSEIILSPFVDFGFMRRALVACIALALGCGPVGVLLILRRMSLTGDAMAHAVLPGAAIGFILAGMSLLAMSAGGIIAGLAVALLAGAVTRFTPMREDAAFAAFYLISLALGVMIVSTHGSSVDLSHVLFGTILAIDNTSLLLVSSIATISLLTMAVIYRPLIVECFDPGFLRAMGGHGMLHHFLFLVLVVVNLVAGFQALGTLMAVGLMMLPAAAARFWTREVGTAMAPSVVIALLSSVAGLLYSFHAGVPSGPAIVLTAGLAYGLSVLGGSRGGILRGLLPRRHLAG